MKKFNKITISLILVFSIIFSYLAPIAPVFAATRFERTEGANLDSVAPVLNEETHIQGKYEAYSNRVKISDVTIYNHGTTTEKECSGNDTVFPYVGNENKCYLRATENNKELYYVIQLGAGDVTYNNIATVLYKDALTYKGTVYDVKLNINSIRKSGTATTEFRILKGKRTSESEDDKFDTSTYTENFNPSIAVGKAEGVKTEVDVEYIIQDKNGREVAISGIYGLIDIDLNQGVFVDNYKVNDTTTNINTYMHSKYDEIKYLNVGNGVYIYTTDENGTEDRNVFLLMSNVSKVNSTATFDTQGAVLGYSFLKNYKVTVTSRIDNGATEINGNVTTALFDSTSETVLSGGNSTNYVRFKPSEGYKITKVTLDGEEISLNKCTYENGIYTYKVEDKNITEDIEHNVIITTEKIQYKVNITSEIDNGATKINGDLTTASSDSTSKTVASGGNSTNKVNFKPSTGYKIIDVTVDGKTVNPEDYPSKDGIYTYTFNDTNITKDINHNVIITTAVKDTSVLIKYVDESGKEIAPSDKKEGKVFDPYTTSPKTIEKYDLIREEYPKNAEGTMTEEQTVVVYKYRLKDAKVIVKYINADTKKPLADDDVINGKVDKEYKTTPKTFKKYRLIDTPKNAEGIMTVEDIEVIYYYTTKDTTVTINYLDEDGNKIADSVEKTGKVDDKYTSEKKDIKGYVIKTIPENAEGTMTEEPTEVNYIYKKKPAKVVVKYVDKDGKEIKEKKTINGDYNEEYNTESEDIPNYNLVKVPDNASGKMDKDETVVTYVYDLKDSTVVANYVDEDGKKIADSERQEGKVTTKYKTEQKKIDGYTIKTIPKNAEGVYTEKEIVVTYVYTKNKPEQPEKTEEPKKEDKVKVEEKDNNTKREVKELPKTGKFSTIIAASIIAIISLFGLTMWVKINKYKDI